MVDDLKFITMNTYSGDRYTATAELWDAYWKSVEGGWELATDLEEGVNPDFYYDP